MRGDAVAEDAVAGVVCRSSFPPEGSAAGAGAGVAAVAVLVDSAVAAAVVGSADSEVGEDLEAVAAAPAGDDGRDD
jgi:hypothetical protein